MRTFNFTLTGLTEDLRPRRDRNLGRAATLVAVLTGIFVLAGTELRLLPGHQDFGSQQVGTSGQVASFSLENSSKDTFEVETRVEGYAASDFVVERSCASVSPGEKCEVTVRFTPTVAESRVARLIVSDASGRLFLGADLRGEGVDDGNTPPPELRISPMKYDFGAQRVGIAGQVAGFSLENRSKEDVAVTVRLEGDASDFVLERSCTGVTAEDKCELAIRFKPTRTELRAARLIVADASGALSTGAELTGTGTGATPRRRIAFDPSLLVFPQTPVGGQRSRQSVRIINQDADTFAVTVRLANTPTIALRSDGCKSVALAAGADCSVVIEFDPRTVGNYETRLSVTDDQGSVHTVPVRGSVTTSTPPGIVFTPNPVTFGLQPAGTASAAQSVTLKNRGSTPLRATYAKLDAETADNFVLGGHCQTFFYGPNSECPETVQFRPRSAGTHNGTVTVLNTAGEIIGSLKLEGSGQRLGMQVRPGKLDFTPPQNRDQIVTVFNDGGASFVIGPVRLGGADSAAFYHDSPSCLSQPLPDQATCAIGVHYRAGLTGTAQARSAELTIEPASLPATRVQLTWTRPPEPAVTASPRELSFGRVPAGSTETLQVTFTNNGNGAANNMVVGFTSDNTPFSVAQNGCGDLAPGASCTVVIAFKPTQAGQVNATLRVWSTNPFTELTTVQVNGDGVANVVGAVRPDDG